MSPIKKKEKLIRIDKERFKAAASKSGVSQKYIAEKILCVTESYFSRKLSSGIIDKDWLFKISDSLDVSRSFLTGESDSFITRLAEKRNELSESDLKSLLKLKEFMTSRGFEDKCCDSLTNEDIDNIAEYIISIERTSYMINYSQDLEQHIADLEQHVADLEKRIKALEDNNSPKD